MHLLKLGDLLLCLIIWSQHLLKGIEIIIDEHIKLCKIVVILSNHPKTFFSMLLSGGGLALGLTTFQMFRLFVIKSFGPNSRTISEKVEV